MNDRFMCLLEIHLAVLLFGVTGLFGKFLTIPAQYITLGRVFFASISLGLVFYIRKVKFRLNGKKDYVNLFLLGALLAFHWTAFYSAVQWSTVAIALLTFSAYPIFVTFIEPIMFHEKIKKLDIVCSIIMFFGVLLVVPEFSLSNNMTVGTIWGMVSCVSFAVLSLYNRLFVKRYSGAIVTFYEQSAAAIVLLPLLCFDMPVMTTIDWELIILLGVIFTGCAHTLLNSGMKLVRAQTVGIIASLETVYGIFFAVLLLSEIPSCKELIGGAIILGTAFISTFCSSKEKS